MIKVSQLIADFWTFIKSKFGSLIYFSSICSLIIRPTNIYIYDRGADWKKTNDLIISDLHNKPKLATNRHPDPRSSLIWHVKAVD